MSLYIAAISPYDTAVDAALWAHEAARIAAEQKREEFLGLDFLNLEDDEDERKNER